jgi:copper transport protein
MNFTKQLFMDIVNMSPYPGSIILSWIQYVSSSVYVGMLFFYLCVLPKGSLQSAGNERRYHKVFHFAFVLLFLSTISMFSLIELNQTNQKVGPIWIVEFMIMILLSSLSFRVFAKKNQFYFWLAFILGIVFLIAKAITAANAFPVMALESLHLMAAAILIGSITALLSLLPIRKSIEGKIFFRGLLFLFFPWGVLAGLILVITVFYNKEFHFYR